LGLVKGGTTAQSTHEIFREVAATGFCRHPIRLWGSTVNRETGELWDHEVRVPCKDRRAAVCPSCSYLYKADAWILVSAGLEGGKGLPTSLASHPRLFLTLTAPSFGAVHTLNPLGTCHPRLAPCIHVGPCRARHAEDDPALGSALCEKCFDYEGAVLWNASCSRLWNRTVEWLKHRLAQSQSMTIAEFRKVAELNYLRIAELQRRGLVHLHCVLRCDGPEGPSSEPPEWLTAELVAKQLLSVVSDLELETPAGSTVRWGTQRDVADLTGASESGRVAAYVAKYATKSSDGSGGMAMRFSDRVQIERVATDEHHRRLALTAWDLGEERPELGALRLQEHAHSLGFTGHLLTKSKRFSTTFGALRGARTAYMADERDMVPVAGTFGFLGRGYSDSRAEGIADRLHQLLADLHKERREARLQEAGEGSGEPPTVG
jgi:hypothetical protein